jgi:hypothetical protein
MSRLIIIFKPKADYVASKNIVITRQYNWQASIIRLNICVMHINRLCRISEIDLFLLEAFMDAQVDRLLDIHVCVLVRREYVVHDFEIE